jgi:photosystem II stability/assembly factor-like uncharacterized protein
MNIGSTLYASGFAGGVSRSTDRGASWVQINTGLTVLDVPAMAHQDGVIIAGTFGGGCFRSTDNGSSWSAINNGLPKDPYDTNSFAVVQGLVATEEAILAGTYYGVYRTTDQGNSWIGTNVGLTFSNVVCLAAENSGVFAGTNGGGLFRSTNGGATWARTDTALPGGGVRAIALTGQQIYSAGTSGVRVSFDFGESWRACELGPGAGDPWSIAATSTKIFVGTYGSVRVSEDSGLTWQRHDEGLPLTFAHIFSLGVSDSLVFASVNGTIWSRPLADPLTTAVSTDAPAVRTGPPFSRCYPNPFNPSTTIRYKLSARSHVRLAIFNMLGQQMVLLQDHVAEVGEHNVMWTTSAPSGMYFYHLTIRDVSQPEGKFLEVGKMVLTR